MLAQRLMGLQLPANRRPRFSYRASGAKRRSLDSSQFVRRSEPAAGHSVAMVRAATQILSTPQSRTAADFHTPCKRCLVELPTNADFSQQDRQASNGLLPGALLTDAPDTSLSKDQQRRSSLDSHLAQMHKLRIFTGGTSVSSCLQCNLCSADRSAWDRTIGSKCAITCLPGTQRRPHNEHHPSACRPAALLHPPVAVLLHRAHRSS